MSEPKMARKSSYVAKCEAGKTYAWWGLNNPGINPIVTEHIPLCKTLRRFYLSAVAEAFAKFFNLN